MAPTVLSALASVLASSAATALIISMGLIAWRSVPRATTPTPLHRAAMKTALWVLTTSIAISLVSSVQLLASRAQI